MAESHRGGVCVELQAGEVLRFEPLRDATVDTAQISITLLKKSGQKARLLVKAKAAFTVDSRKPVPA